MEGHDQMAQSVSAVLLSLNGAVGFGLEMKYNKQGNQQHWHGLSQQP